MPRKTYRRRRVVRRRRYGGKKTIRSIVKRELNKNIEMKLRQYQYDSVGIDPVTGSATSFNSVSYGSGSIVAGLAAGVANGTGEGQRIGNKITIKGLQVNFALQPGDTTNYMRFIIATPKKEITKASMSAFIQQLLANTSSAGTQWLAPVDSDVWKVYADKRYFMHYAPTDGSTASTIPIAKFFKKFIRLRKNIKWALSAPVQPTNDIYLIALSDSVTVAHPGAVAGFVKIWYQDA